MQGITKTHHNNYYFIISIIDNKIPNVLDILLSSGMKMTICWKYFFGVINTWTSTSINTILAKIINSISICHDL